MGRAGRPQLPPKGSTEAANALAAFLRKVTAQMTVRELAERYGTGKTLWSEYRSGARIIPLGRLYAVIKDRVRDERGRAVMLAKARELYEAAVTAEQDTHAAADPGAARRQAQADRDEAEKLVNALLRIITVLTDAADTSAAPSQGAPTRPLDEARHRLKAVRQVLQAAEQVLADTTARRPGTLAQDAPPPGPADGGAPAPGVPPQGDRAPEPDGELLPVPPPATRGTLAVRCALVHEQVEEQRGEIVRLWHQVRPADPGTAVVRGVVLERVDNLLTGELANPGGPEPAGTGSRRGRARLLLATAVAAAVTAAVTGVVLHDPPPARHDAHKAASPSPAGSSPSSSAGPSRPAPGPGSPSAEDDDSRPSSSSPSRPAADIEPDTDEEAGRGAEVTDPPGVYAVSAGGRVLQWSGAGTTWDPIGGDADTVIAGGAGLFSVSGSDGWISQYRPATGEWERIGSPGAQFIQQGSTLYALRPQRDAVMRWNGREWDRIGGGSAKLYAGPAGLLSINPDTKDLWRYNGAPDDWTRIGNPGADFAVGEHIWGISPDRNSVFQWSGNGDAWFRVGDAADRIYAGGAGMFIVRHSTHQILKYNGPFSFTPIGTPGADLVVTDRSVYRISSDRKTISRWTGDGTTWTTIGASATSLAATE